MRTRHVLATGLFMLCSAAAVHAQINPVDMRSGWFGVLLNSGSSSSTSPALFTVPAGYNFVLTDAFLGTNGSSTVNVVVQRDGSAVMPIMSTNPPPSVHMNTGIVYPAGSVLQFSLFTANGGPSAATYVLSLGWSGYLVSTATSGVLESAGALLGMRVHPNPSNGAAEVEFELSRAGKVGLSVYDASGRRVARLPQARMSAGRHTLLWDGKTSGGAPSPPGMYVARLEGDGIEGSKRIILRD